MKLKTGFVRGSLDPVNAGNHREVVKNKQTDAVYGVLLTVLAEASDAIAKGEQVWIAYGATRDRGALVLTLHVGSERATAAGSTLAEVARAAEGLLEPT